MILGVNKPWLEAGYITVTLGEEDDDLYSVRLDLSADGYAGKELAMNVVDNAKCDTGGSGTLTSAAHE